MAVGANAIRGGGVAIEFFGDLSQLTTALDNAKKRVTAWGKSITALGTGMLDTGMQMGRGLMVGVNAFATYEQSMADLRAATNLSAADMARADEAIRALALATGTMPAEVAKSFAELAKAGIDIEKIIGGVGEASLKFARVSGMPMAETAIVLADAMNMFKEPGMTAAHVTDIMGRAADAASLSLAQVAESMSSGGSIAGMFNQSLQDTATALVFIAKYGSVKGATAGNAIKTLLTRLATGKSEDEGDAGDEVSKSIQELGLVVRDAHGQMLPFPILIKNIQDAMAGRSQADQDRLMKGLAGMRGLLGLAPLLRLGANEWDNMQAQMMNSLPIAERFNIVMDTLQGAAKRIMVQVTMAAIAVGQALAPALRVIADLMGPVISTITEFLSKNADIIQAFAFDAAKAVAFGVALIGLGGAIQFAGFAIGIIGGMLGALYPIIGFVTSGFGLLTVAQLAWQGVMAAGSILLAGWNAMMAIGPAIMTAWGAVVSVGSVIMTAWGIATGIASSIMSAFWVVVNALTASLWIETIALSVAKAATWLYSAALAAAGIAVAAFKIGTFVLVAGLAMVIGALMAASTGSGTFSLGAALASIATTAWTVSVNLLTGAIGLLVAALVAAPIVMFVKAMIAGVAAGNALQATWAAVSASVGIASNSIRQAVNDTVTAFGTLFGNLGATGKQSLQGFLDAFRAKDWALGWELFKSTAMLVWHDVSTTAMDTFLTWKFALTRMFYDIGDVIKSVLTNVFSDMAIGFWDNMREVPGFGDRARFQIGRIRLRQEGAAEDMTRDQANRRTTMPISEAWQRRLAEELDPTRRGTMERMLASISRRPDEFVTADYLARVRNSDATYARLLGFSATQAEMVETVAEEIGGSGGDWGGDIAPAARNRTEQRAQLQAAMQALVRQAAEPYQLVRDFMAEYEPMADAARRGGSLDFAEMQGRNLAEELEYQRFYGRTFLGLDLPDPFAPNRQVDLGDLNPNAGQRGAGAGSFGSFLGAAISAMSFTTPAERTARAVEQLVELNQQVVAVLGVIAEEEGGLAVV